MRRHLKYTFGLFFAGLMLCTDHVRAELSQQELLTFSNEPPVIAELLQRAVRHERKAEAIDGSWQAARLYCEASRYGSAEAHYRLGMLYAIGRGVPLNPDLAASLFAAASMHGHYESQKMLETIEFKHSELPPCVLSAVDPERAHETEAIDIDTYIANLPKNKRWIVRLVDTIAAWYQVDPKLVLSLISVESNFAVTAKSNKKAQGLMQLIPETAERFNVKNAFDASQNIKGGIAYLRWLLAYYEGDVSLAVAAYNAGEGAVNKYKGIPPFSETRQYVQKVRAKYPLIKHPYDHRITAPSQFLKRSG